MKIAREIAELQARVVADALYPITLTPASKSRQVRKEETERFASKFEQIITTELNPIKDTLQYVLDEEERQMGKVAIDCLEEIIEMLSEE